MPVLDSAIHLQTILAISKVLRPDQNNVLTDEGWDRCLRRPAGIAGKLAPAIVVQSDGAG